MANDENALLFVAIRFAATPDPGRGGPDYIQVMPAFATGSDRKAVAHVGKIIIKFALIEPLFNHIPGVEFVVIHVENTLAVPAPRVVAEIAVHAAEIRPIAGRRRQIRVPGEIWNVDHTAELVVGVEVLFLLLIEFGKDRLRRRRGDPRDVRSPF